MYLAAMDYKVNINQCYKVTSDKIKQIHYFLFPL